MKNPSKNQIRRMSNTYKGFNFYTSSFDMKSGTLVRSVEVAEERSRWSPPRLSDGLNVPGDKETLWSKKFGNVFRGRGYTHSSRNTVGFSPVPETIDVKITDWCNGPGNELCSYCYMSSGTSGKHAPRELLTTIFDGLKTPPYQIAFGGGEPTAHPDFPWFLQYTREHKSVPNYTTAGHIMRPEVIEATNKYCGGVALTYHSFKVPKWFGEVYRKWREALMPHVQLNVHVIFDDRAAESILELVDEGLTDLNLVLLAYYPNVGRATLAGLPGKGTYQHRVPSAIKEAVEKARFKVAFSEGLLPYFLSHRIPEVDTTFAMRQEGYFSCYVDNYGSVSQSSFDPPDVPSDTEKNYYPNIYKTKFQTIWNKLKDQGSSGFFDVCSSCELAKQCHVVNDFAFLLCKFASHNSSESVDKVPARERARQAKHLPVVK